MQEIKLVLQEKTFFLIKTMMVTIYAMPVVSEETYLFSTTLPPPSFQPQLPNPKRTSSNPN